MQWLPRLPDLSAPDFFLWGHLKDFVYRTNPCTTEELKGSITEEVQAIEDIRCCLMEDLLKRFQEYIEKQGGHLAGVLFKTKHY
jgi:hypothetical protein